MTAMALSSRNAIGDKDLICRECSVTLSMAEYIEQHCLRCHLPEIAERAETELRRRRIAERHVARRR